MQVFLLRYADLTLLPIQVYLTEKSIINIICAAFLVKLLNKKRLEDIS